MAPSPRKNRASPRKKAWAVSPKVSRGSSTPSIFSDADFSPLDKSWAETTANDKYLNNSIAESLTKRERHTRKTAVPKKTNSQPKFVRSLTLTEEVYGKSRRSERIKEKRRLFYAKTDELTADNECYKTDKDAESVMHNVTDTLSNTEEIFTGHLLPSVEHSDSRIRTPPPIPTEQRGRSIDVPVEKRPRATDSLQTKESRKRHLSTASSSTLNKDCEGCSPIKRINSSVSNDRPARKNLKIDTAAKSPCGKRRLFTPTGKKSTSTMEFTPKDFWEDPTLGWCQDQKVLDRRTKEIERAKEKPVYARYLAEIPRHLRVKGVHPRTPNKHINFSRRSWDSQIRSWKRSLYDWAGEEPSDSVNTSFCSYSSEESQQDYAEQENRYDSILIDLKEFDEIQIRPETDAMASLLGHFDLSSRKGDESTLKAPTSGQLSGGPLDFSTLKA